MAAKLTPQRKKLLLTKAREYFEIIRRTASGRSITAAELLSGMSALFLPDQEKPDAAEVSVILGDLIDRKQITRFEDGDCPEDETLATYALR